MLKGIGNTSAKNNTSHITQVLKDKVGLESRGEKIQFYWIPGHCGVEVNETADSAAKQSIKEGRDSQLLLPVADLKSPVERERQRGASHFSQNTKWDTGENYFERYHRNGFSPWFCEIKMNCHAFVSINRMRAGHSSPKANLK
jgi:hypothetical protein